MPDHDSTDEKRGANSEREQHGDPIIRQRVDRDVAREFNLPASHDERMAKLSPTGRKNVEILIKHGSDRLEREEVDQRRSHKFRVLAEENRRLKEVLRHPDLKLGQIPFAGQAEIENIESVAVETVRRREEGHRQTIKEDVRYSIDREMADDFRRQSHGQNHDAARDDHEHER